MSPPLRTYSGKKLLQEASKVVTEHHNERLTEVEKDENEEDDDFFVAESREVEPAEALNLKSQHCEQNNDVDSGHKDEK